MTTWLLRTLITRAHFRRTSLLPSLRKPPSADAQRAGSTLILGLVATFVGLSARRYHNAHRIAERE